VPFQSALFAMPFFCAYRPASHRPLAGHVIFAVGVYNLWHLVVDVCWENSSAAFYWEYGALYSSNAAYSSNASFVDQSFGEKVLNAMVLNAEGYEIKSQLTTDIFLRTLFSKFSERRGKFGAQ